MKTILNDLRHEIRHLNTSRKALRNFMLAGAILSAALSGLAFYKDNAVGAHWAIASALLLAGAWLRPEWIRPVYVILASAAAVVGYFLSRLILIIVFVTLVTPFSLILRLIGKDPLHRRLDRNATTYWLPKPKAPTDSGAYEKLF